MKPGDMVQLKGGSGRMLVEKIHPTGWLDLVWFDERGNKITVQYHEQSLKLAESPK